jgi:hypothetical protein
MARKLVIAFAVTVLAATLGLLGQSPAAGNRTDIVAAPFGCCKI